MFMLHLCVVRRKARPPLVHPAQEFQKILFFQIELHRTVVAGKARFVHVETTPPPQWSPETVRGVFLAAFVDFGRRVCLASRRLQVVCTRRFGCLAPCSSRRRMVPP